MKKEGVRTVCCMQFSLLSQALSYNELLPPISRPLYIESFTSSILIHRFKISHSLSHTVLRSTQIFPPKISFLHQSQDACCAQVSHKIHGSSSFLFHLTASILPHILIAGDYSFSELKSRAASCSSLNEKTSTMTMTSSKPSTNVFSLNSTFSVRFPEFFSRSLQK